MESNLEEYFDAPIEDSTSPGVVLIALSKWVSLMRAMDASGDARHKEVLAVLMRLVHVWAAELQENPSYDELGQQLVDNVVGAVELKNTFKQ